jgi:hypothetical protein
MENVHSKFIGLRVIGENFPLKTVGYTKAFGVGFRFLYWVIPSRGWFKAEVG